MIYHKISLSSGTIHFKRLSGSVPLYKILHQEGTMEIFKHISSGRWSTLYCSGAADKYSAAVIGPEIESYYGQLDTSAARFT